MAEVTVTELAKTVGASVDRLLMQMKDAGLSHESVDASVSDEEKQILLTYLKGLHGESSGEPKKITLRRKTLSTLRSSNRKTVNIEVRKKRTYVKRSDEELQAQAELETEAKAREEAEATTRAAKLLNQEPLKSSGTDDIEDKRVAAVAGRRKAVEEAQEAERKEAQEKLQEEARKAAEAASALESEEAKKAGKTTKYVAAPQNLSLIHI